MVSILGYNAWRDKDSFNTVNTSKDISSLTLKNIPFRGVSLENNIDNRMLTEVPLYDAGNTIVHSKFLYSVFDSIIRADFTGLHKIVIYRWIPSESVWADIKTYILASSSRASVNYDIMRTITYDTSLVSLVVKYKIEYYKWINEISTLQEDQTRYLELEYQLQSNFISDVDEIFPLFIDVSITLDKVLSVASLQPLMSLYPIIIKNSMTNYSQGTFAARLMTGDLLEKLRTGTGGYDLEAQAAMIEYKNKVLNFLTNGKPKCIRTIQGEMFIVSITGNIDVQWIHFGTGYQCDISFNWMEIADANSSEAVKRVNLTY